VHARTFEITFVGQAGAVVRAEFDDCEISVGPGGTTLRAGLIDQSALQGLLQRISGVGLELIEVRVVPPPAETTDRDLLAHTTRPAFEGI
jgi:hypothetical protein